MGIVETFLKGKLDNLPPVRLENEAVLLYVDNEDLDGSIPLQLTLHDLLKDSEVGMFDGNEVGGGELVIFLYGPDAEALFKFVEPTLRADDFCKGARVVIRWGGPEAPRRQVIL